jgi:protein gp37
LKWNRLAAMHGRREKVFCASLADVFEDRPDLNYPLARLLKWIHITPHLDWQLLTKRADRILARLKDVALLGETEDQDINDGACIAQQWLYGSPMPNIWLMTSVENQQYADRRIPELLKIPAVVRGLSVEPLLGPVDLDISRWGSCYHEGHSGRDRDADHRECACHLDWVIIGGESGPQARPCQLEWVRHLVHQCKAAGVACFVKQLGTKPVHGNPHDDRSWRPFFQNDPKGGDPAEWPEDLRIREFPHVPSP